MSHAKLSPSSAYRWFVCPGSVALSEKFPDESNEYAREGTAAHTVAEYCLRKDLDAHALVGTYEGRIRVDYREKDGTEAVQHFDVTPEMATAVQIYLDHCRSLIGDPPSGHLLAEQRVELGSIHDQLQHVWGTADCIVYLPATRTLHVVDLKYGRGKVVEAENNVQLKIYALAAWATFHKRWRVEHVVTSIVQPRAGGEAIRTAEYPAVGLLDFAQDVVDAVLRVEQENAQLVPGDHCDFCRAKAACPALADKAMIVAQDEFAMADPATLDVERCVALLEKAELLELWVRGVREHLHALALQGVTIPGYKLVPKRATRQWAAPEDEVVRTLTALGVSEEDCYTRELVSPAQAERRTGKKRFPAELVASVSSGYNLVKDVDSRPAVTLHPGDDFAAIPHTI